MKKFTTLKSIPAYLSLQNIDTDMIIPKQFLKTIKRTGLGKSLFYEMRYDENGKKNADFILNKEPYNNSKILDLLIIAPYFIISLTFLILLSIYLISFYSNKSERDRLWTGLAKETAHQLGTPLSSLIGWNEYLKSKKKVDKGFISSEIDKDLNRLKIITDRFSTIGSKPSLIDTDIKKNIIESIDYLKRRVSPNVKTKLNLETVNYNFNKQLFGWVIENLYKNSIDAIGKNGNVEIKLYEDKDSVIIDFIDDGIGINKSDFSKIFKPGFTTKERGWGLGLTLVNRIISDYHKGRIYVKNSIKNVETTIRIELKKVDKKS